MAHETVISSSNEGESTSLTRLGVWENVTILVLREAAALDLRAHIPHRITQF